MPDSSQQQGQQTAATALAILNVAGQAALYAIEAYQRAHQLAIQHGASQADMDAATARFTAIYDDPLKPKV